MPVLTNAPFGARLAEALQQTKSALCVGIDPHPSLMTPLFCDKGQVTIDGLRAFSLAVIEAARGLVPAIKPQAALFNLTALMVCRFWQRLPKLGKTLVYLS